MENPKPIHVWAAAPTPLTAALGIDVPAAEKMVADAVAGGLHGLFLGGTCGEGLWLRDRDRRVLVETVARAAHRRLEIAVQVSDNSVPRVLDNIAEARQAGADVAVVAPAMAMMNATPSRIAALFEEVVRRSPLPVGIYDLGPKRSFSLPEEDLRRIYLLPGVTLVKDSSAAPARRAIALAARREKPGLRLFNGDEFRGLEYLQAGYDGVMFGGAVAVMPHLRRLVGSFQAGRLAEAAAVDAEMKDILWGLYGGKDIACWLTGLKYFLVRRGVFSTPASFFEYPLTDGCRAFIDRYAAGLAAGAGPDQRRAS